MLQHLLDESFFNMAMDALSNGMEYAKHVVFMGLPKSNQDIYIYIYSIYNGHPWIGAFGGPRCDLMGASH